RRTIPSTRRSEITNPLRPAGRDPDAPLAVEWPPALGVIHGLKGSRRPAAVDRMLVTVVCGDSAPAALAGAFLEDLSDARRARLGMTSADRYAVWSFSLLVEGGVVAGVWPARPAPAAKPRAMSPMKSTLTARIVRWG